MKYQDIESAARTLDRRDKLRLAQLLIQMARKEEEEDQPRPQIRTPPKRPETEYVRERLLKLRPKTRSALCNSIRSMYQFRGGISETDTEALIAELCKSEGVTITQNEQVVYRE